MEQSKCRVYSRFTATRSDGSTVKLRIQDMPPEYLEAAIDIQNEYFTKEEPYHRAAGIYKNADAKAESRQLLMGYLHALKSHVDICCVDDDPDVVGALAGVSAMYLTEGSEDFSMLKGETKENMKLIEIWRKTFHCYDVKKEQNVDKYYEDLFIVVHPDYRRLGIAKEFLKARRLICELDKVPMACSWMSALGTQKAGEADGWQTVVENSNEEIAKRFDVVFEDAPPTNKYMLVRVPLK
ncbi:hypothetical protein evm_005796 [Chilo suppressalis]|nr:hypothetical protein evm_005796 [Chilo suppressalis]